MKKKLLMSLSAIALSITFLLSGAEFTTQAADSIPSNHVCTDFDYKIAFSCEYLNPAEHWVNKELYSICVECRETEYLGVIDSYTEYHDYILDYSTNVLTCSGCDDSYDYTK